MRFLAFNTRRGLFRDPVLRRAAALALDRRSLSEPSGERPWDSLIGAGMPGAPDRWHAPVAGPDLARAQALARGRGGDALMFINTPRPLRELRGGRGAGAAASWRRIGIRVRVRPTRAPRRVLRLATCPADLILMGWIYDWPDPSNVLNAMFDRGRPLGYGFAVVDRLFDDAQGAARGLRAANATAGPARDAAYRRADERRCARRPPVSPFARNDQPTLLSTRVGCASGVPQDYGQLNLAALCLK